MKILKKLIADAVFYSGHYGSKGANVLLELGLKMHVDFDTDTGRKITAVRQELEKKLRDQMAKPQEGGKYVRGQSIFVKASKPKTP